MAVDPSLAQQPLIRFLLESGALKFGEFTLKSGRISPYFFNTAAFDSGARLETLGRFYAQEALKLAPRATVVFGPAYKGIPLCLSTAIAMQHQTGRDTGWLFDRKEAKTHGDQGRFVGRIPGRGDRLVLVDDVITDGETKRQAVAMLRECFDAPIDGLVIAFNRMEQDSRGEDALEGFQQATGVAVSALLTLAQLHQTLEQGGVGLPGITGDPSVWAEKIQEYRTRYGMR
ncbi:MAG: orotate phosphoribosyltransferase [Deltaproteobacteria bacterium]|nr:orotate phosphoribosyltransferase [Deltaproteobacteria bacterium]